MTPSQAQVLVDKLDATENWPPKWEHAWASVKVWQAFREADGTVLQRQAGWDTEEHRHRNYIVDPLPAKLSGTFAELIFGEDPTITAAAESDQARLDAVIEDNELPSELQTAADVCVSEGEVWWRILVDRDRADVPLIEFHSRLKVLPLFRGRTLLACAFVSSITDDKDDRKVYRYMEIHGDGVALNVLYQGTPDKLGKRVALTDRPETADLKDAWQHNLGMLAGRIVNKQGRNPHLGVSDYRGVADLLFALNETATIGQENARLTLKKRVVVPQRYLDVRGNFPAGADVIVAADTDSDPDKPGDGLAQVEWEFDATAFIDYKNNLERTILGRVGLAKQLVDAGDPTPDGRATGTALRLRLIPSVLATNGKARYWDDQLPRILMLTQLVDRMSDSEGGIGFPWSNPASMPMVERTDPLPEDEVDEANRHALLVGAEIESRQTAIETMHDDWDEARVLDELRRIKDEQPSMPVLDTPPFDTHTPPPPAVASTSSGATSA